jgi:UDP-glucuronate 4-epimerase
MQDKGIQKILITGVAGFIGFHLALKLINEGFKVAGVDSLNDYYDINLKLDRVNQLKKKELFEFHSLNICEKDALDDLFAAGSFDYVINLAAQAGVRYSIEKPYKYADSNLMGFLNILECCRNHPVKHLLYASSSSVYGMNAKTPFAPSDSTDMPASLYAATKKANELMAYAYAHNYEIPCTGLRFFTVYGPWGRPDMAYFSFTKNILEGKPIKVFNNGEMSRDFTFIDDVVTAIHLLIAIPPSYETNSGSYHRVLNIGNNDPVKLPYFISLIEEYTQVAAIKEYAAMHSGDVVSTFADIEDLYNLTGFSPKTSIETGLKKFVDWYFLYYSKEQKTVLTQL